jgi:succinate-semialdehyde dehydrogenase/glutarate-semialdehyde dehydrogenase
VIAHVADATREDARLALDAAVSAQAAWARTPSRERSAILIRAFELVMARSEAFAQVITQEMGKSLADARAEVAYGADFLRWFAEEAVRIKGTFARSPDGKSDLITLKEPVGPALLITPWNFPLAMATRKIGPALAAGCTAVVKPASQTPLTTLMLASTLEEAGVPDGVVNVLTTSKSSVITDSLLSDPRLRKVSFTGSTEVGRLLTEKAASNLLRVSMELGGNAPFVVFEDADLDLAVAQALVAKLRNGGQSCTAANRFLVHERVASAFGERLAAAFDALVVGAGDAPGTDVGPMIDGSQRTSIGELVEDALAHGAKALTKPRALPATGYFIAPTVLGAVDRRARVVCEEIFGPVAPILTFRNDGEAIEMANDTEHGLVAFVFSRDLDRCRHAAGSIESGMVGINRGLVSNAAAPFGGIKHSGVGREGGDVGIDEYLSLKYVAA